MLSREAFRKANGHICPHCETTDPATVTGDEWMDNGNYTADVTCNSCRKSWCVIWQLAGYFVLPLTVPMD